MKKAGPMRAAFEAGGTGKEARPFGRRPGLGQRLDAGSMGKEAGPILDPDPMRCEVTKTGRK